MNTHLEDFHEIRPDRRAWDLVYYREILQTFVDAGYRSLTFSEYFDLPPAERKNILLLRKDIDDRPDRIPGMLEIQSELGIRATYFFHLHAKYNMFFYDVYFILKQLIKAGNEIGLHSNFVEFSKYFGENPVALLKRERAILETLCGLPIAGHACHRDINYLYNSLPYLNKVGIKEMGFRWSAYDPIFISENITYVNEGLNPHLTWRNMTPENAIKTGNNICMMLHPHWWHQRFHTGA